MVWLWWSKQLRIRTSRLEASNDQRFPYPALLFYFKSDFIDFHGGSRAAARLSLWPGWAGWAGWASGLAGWATGLAGWTLDLVGWASGLDGWASDLAGGR